MKFTLRLILALFCNNLFSQEAPELLSSVDYKTEIISTDEGDFTAWILEDDDARKLYRQVKVLEKIDVDRTNDFLAFTIYSDDDYEYVVAKQKQKYRKMKFFRITAYSI